MKILILVTNSTFYPSNIILPFLKNTWGKDERVNIIYYQGGENKTFLDKDTLKVAAPLTFERVSEKGLKAFEWILENIDFDVVYRCTTTTYLDIDNLIAFLEDKKMDNFLCGVTNTFPHHPETPEDEKITFVSGAGCFFSKDVVKKLVENKKSYDFSLLDDVAIGKLLIKNLEVPVTEGYYQDFLHGYPLFKDIDFENYHYRFKLGSVAHTPYYPRYLEIITLLSIHLRKKIGTKKSSILSFFVYLVDLTVYLIYEIFRILNPHFIKYKLKSFFIFLRKILIKTVKILLLRRN